MPPSLVIEPIGYVRSPFVDKSEAPRQAHLAASDANDVTGRVEILPAYADALSDLEGFERVWLVFWFHRAAVENRSWRSKVLPPRSDEKRGVFATRSPHRPNPIGISAVRLDRVEGLTLHVRDLDVIDGTPVLDIKPYLAYADAFPEAGAGWLEARDPRAPWTVAFEPVAEAALAWIAGESGLDLRGRISSVLALGPQPHAYRRIKETSKGRHVLAVKEWRAHFRVEGDRSLIVEKIASGYRARDLEAGEGAVHVLHRAFVARQVV